MSRPPSLLVEDAQARHLVRERALALAMQAVYFPAKRELLKALQDGRIGMGDLLLAGDAELLARAGVTLDTLDEPAGSLES